MRPEDIIALLRKSPFQPFRIWVSDGAHFDVSHPDLAMVFRTIVVIGVPGRRGPDGPLEKSVNVALVHITRTEALDAATVNA